MEMKKSPKNATIYKACKILWYELRQDPQHPNKNESNNWEILH